MRWYQVTGKWCRIWWWRWWFISKVITPGHIMTPLRCTALHKYKGSPITGPQTQDGLIQNQDCWFCSSNQIWSHSLVLYGWDLRWRGSQCLLYHKLVRLYSYNHRARGMGDNTHMAYGSSLSPDTPLWGWPSGSAGPANFGTIRWVLCGLDG